MTPLVSSTTTLFLLLLLFTATSHALYEGDPHVKNLNSNEEFDKITADDSIWIVQFYDDAEGNDAKQTAPSFSHVANLLRGIIQVGAVDITTEQGSKLKSLYSIKKTPAMLIFGHDKQHPTSYDGPPNDPQSMIQALLDSIMKTLEFRSTGKTSSSDPKKKHKKKTSSTSKVISLDASNFEERVLNNPQVSLVAFIAPWCGHCKKLLPEWEEAATMLDGEEVMLGKVDATVEEELAAIYGVRGYPTIKVFPGGKNKSHGDAVDYQGPREAAGIVRYALAEVDRSGVVKEIPELLSQDMLESSCGGHNRICVLAALPHILDSGAAGRDKYRDTLAAVAKSFRGSAFQFLWFEGTSQPKFEDTVELTFGFPAIVALSLDRNAYAVLHGSFSEKSISSFLHGITTGRQPTVKLERELPQLNTVEAWDGQDGVPPEEEIDLAEIMGWDDVEEGGGGEL